MIKKKKPRNYILANVAKKDPGRFKTRIVDSKSGKGRKNRPRQNKIDEGDFYIYA